MRIKVPWYKFGASLEFFFMALLVIGARLGLIQLAVVAGLFCLFVSVIWIGGFLGSERELEHASVFANPAQPCYDIIKVFSTLKRIQTEFLSSKQLRTFNRYRVFCSVELGNCVVAKNLLDEGDFEPAFRHFILGVIANGEGDYELAQQELNMGFAAANDKTDPYVLIQMEHNRAIEHIDDGQFRTANDELEKLRMKVRNAGVHDKAFIKLLYENLVLNKAKLGAPDGGAAEGWALIDEYAKTLDLDNGLDRGSLFNLKLLFLRELGSEREKKAGLFADEVSCTLDDESLSDDQRDIAMASLGRIAWADGLNPARILEYFESRDLIFNNLTPENRIFVFKNLSTMLGSLMTADSRRDRIASAVVLYFQTSIQHDLDAWESMLPAEAIKLRAHILRERAALCQQERGNCNQVAVYLMEAIKLLEQGLQNMDALELRWELIKCLIPSKPKDAKKLLNEVEKRLAALGKQPSLGYPYYEVCLCYGLLGMGGECRAAYMKAVSFKASLGHYAPTVRGDATMAAFCARFYLMMEALESPERVVRYLRTKEGRDWMASYPEKMCVLSLNILLGRFLGFEGPLLIERRLTDIGEGHAIAAYWISMPELGLVFDPAIKKDGDQRGSVFLHDGHPLVSNESNYELLMQCKGFKTLPLEFKPCDESELNETDRVAIKDVLGALNIECKNQRPTTEDLLKYYLDGCAAVPIED